MARFLSLTIFAACASCIHALTTGDTDLSPDVAQRLTPLVPFVLQPLPLGSITPNGWLNDQLGLMRDGLAGHEHDFYDYVAHSSWLGGTHEYSDLNEGFPYWFNGLVPLAYSLNDDRLKAQVHSAANYVLTNTTWKDGWIGPENVTGRNFWARYPLCLGFVQLAEANSTWTKPVVKALRKFSILMHTMLKNGGEGFVETPGMALEPGDYQWGQVRVQDMMITLQWLYENHPAGNGSLLLDNMNMLYALSMKWEAWYNKETYYFQDVSTITNETALTLNFPYLHGVNVGQGLKAPAVIRRFTFNDSLLTTAMDAVNWTFTYHGSAAGNVLADERLEGLSPYSGSELCTAVETMFSLTYMYHALGTSYYADRAEITAYNALPAMLTPDWWAHQYMEQPNQPYAINLTSVPFWNVNNVGQTFGLEPDFPCCSVNHPQGFPKFLSATYTRVGEYGIAHALLNPATVTARISGGNVTIGCETNYPFTNDLFYTITNTVKFNFYVRVPAWAESSSTITVGSAAPQALSPDSTTGLHTMTIPAGTTKITYHLSRSIVTEARANDTIAVYHGPLLYALHIDSSTVTSPPANWSSQEPYPQGYAPSQALDYQYFNESAWSVAIDPATLSFVSPPGASIATLANPIFAPQAPPTYMTALGCEIAWPLLVPGTASLPSFPPPLSERKCLGSHFNITLVPYASAKLHMSDMPTIKLV